YDLGSSLFTTAARQLVNGDSVASVSLNSAGAAETAAKGPYAITANAALAGAHTDLANYTISYADGTLTVNARALTVTANNQSKTYGDAIAFVSTEFTTAAGQLVNGDMVASVSLRCAAAGATAAKGSYAITPSAALPGLHTDLANYDVSYVDGTLTVNARPLTVTANNQSKTYGELKDLGTSLFTTAAGQLVNRDALPSVSLLSTGADAAAAKGSYAITPSAALAGLHTDLANYTISYADGTLTVNARPLTVTANNQSKTYGEAFTFNGSEFSTAAGQLVNGDSVASVSLN